MGPPVAGEEPSLEDSGAAAEASPSEPSPVSLELAAETQDPGPGTGRPRSNSSKSRLRHRSRTIHERLNRSRRRRASDQPFLSMPLEQYLEMVQWAANQWLAGQDRPPPARAGVAAARSQGRPGPLVRRRGPIPGVVSQRSRVVGRVGQRVGAFRAPLATRNPSLSRCVHVTGCRSLRRHVS